MSLRFEYVPKAKVSPLVIGKYRKMGVAKRLYSFGENWAKSKCCIQIGSDALDWNKIYFRIFF